MDDLIERIENVLKLYENDVVEFPKWELREAADALSTLSSEVKNLKYNIDYYKEMLEEIQKVLGSKMAKDFVSGRQEKGSE